MRMAVIYTLFIFKGNEERFLYEVFTRLNRGYYYAGKKCLFTLFPTLAVMILRGLGFRFVAILSGSSSW